MADRPVSVPGVTEDPPLRHPVPHRHCVLCLALSVVPLSTVLFVLTVHFLCGLPRSSSLLEKCSDLARITCRTGIHSPLVPESTFIFKGIELIYRNIQESMAILNV